MNFIVYPIGNSLYLNITNRCTNQCVFCIRNKAGLFNGKYPLWLEKEPLVEEIIEAIDDPTKYEQIVFCGYGEPLIRLDVVKEVVAQLKALTPGPSPRGRGVALAHAVKVRVDTNGQANLFWGRNILPELEGLVDKMSISIDAPDAETYQKICRSEYGEKAFDAIIEFIKEAKKYIPEVEVSIVDLPNIDKDKSRKLAEELGVSFRIRPYYEEKYVK